MLHPTLETIRKATEGTPFEGDLFLVGGAVRDELLGLPQGSDFDLVTRGSSGGLACLLFERGVSTIQPVVYERFGTAMVQVEGIQVEIVTARKESYDPESRKPEVQAATYEEDGSRRDFTLNALMKSLHSGELRDPTGMGVQDLESRTLRTPLDPVATFTDDPLRMLRAVRFARRFGFTPAPGMFDAIRSTRDRLQIVSMERVRDELVKILQRPGAELAFADLMELGLLEIFAPEFLPMVGCEQGKFHFLDVWDHTLLVLKNIGVGDPLLGMAALLHDVGKPETRFVDANGETRFFGHEAVGESIARRMLNRLKFSGQEIATITLLVKNHMRLGSSPEFTKPAARRVLRDLGENVDRLLDLVEADANSLRPGVRVADLGPIRQRLQEVQVETPVAKLTSPLAGNEIMDLMGLDAGPEIGKIKHRLTELVLEGVLAPDDKEGAVAQIRAWMQTAE